MLLTQSRKSRQESKNNVAHILIILPETFAICRLDAGTPAPQWALQGSFFTITRTEEELSITCEERLVPREVERVERGWRALKLIGPIPFEVTGVIASLSKPLADAGISVSVVATYDTDYLFVKSEKLAAATKALSDSGARVGCAVSVGQKS